MNVPISRREAKLAERRIPVFEVPVADSEYDEAADLLDSFLERHDRARSVYFANAHTLNCAHDSSAYREVLRRADCVFGDGTGVRWAVRTLHGVSLRANVNGTDLVPYFMERAQQMERGLRIFLLGARPDVLARTVGRLRQCYPGWRVAGWHHGYVNEETSPRVVRAINRAQPDLLLVAMGNPRQEEWIDRNLARLDVPLLCMGVGGGLKHTRERSNARPRHARPKAEE